VRLHRTSSPDVVSIRLQEGDEAEASGGLFLSGFADFEFDVPCFDESPDSGAASGKTVPVQL